MSRGMRIGALLLAAGRSSRFGGNKLLADFGGRPVVCRAMDALRKLEPARTAVVTGDQEVAALSQAFGFDVLENRKPEEGMSRSIRLGVSALGDMDAILLLAGDQPLITGESLKRLCAAFAQSGRGIACLRDATHIGNPAVFAKRYYPQLLALEGDRGAKGILRANAQDLVCVDCVRSDELCDCDDAGALEILRLVDNA